MLLKNIGSQGIYLYAYTVATGLAKTGDSANITGYSSIDGATTGTVFATTNPTEISSANMPGVYWQPLAQGETNGNAISYAWKSATAGVAIDPAMVLTSGVNLPAVAHSAASGLVTSGTGTGQLSVSSGLVTLAGVTHTGAVIPTVTTVTNQLTAAAIATGVWQDATAGDFTTASSIGKSLYTSGAVPGAAGGLFIAGTNAATTVTTSFTTTFTGNLTGSVGSVTGAVGSVTGAVGSVTGNVGGNVTGSVGSVTTGGITSASFAAGAINAAAIASDAITDAKVASDVTIASVTGAVGSVTAGVTLAAATHTGAVIPTVTTVTNQLTAAAIATGVWQDATAGDFTTASSIGKSLYTGNVVPGGAGGLFIAGTNAATTITTALTTTFTGNLTGNVGGNVTGSVGSVTAAITLPTIPSDWITAAGIATDAIGSAELAATAVAEIADQVWDEVLSGHLTGGTTGAALNGAGAAGDPWGTALPGAYSAGSAGFIVGTNLDALISSRLAPTTSGRTLDVTTGGEAGIDWANVGSPTTTLNLSGTTVKTLTDAVTLPTIPSDWITAAGIATDAIGSAELAATAVAEIADAVWDEVISGHLTGGTTGAALNGAGSAGDPWTTSLPGAYGAGTAGFIVGTNLDATISSRASAANLATVDDFLDTEIGDIVTRATDIQARLPAALVSGRIDASVGAIAANAITATSIASDAITDAKVASDVTIASVTGAVGSVTGNVGGNVTGSVGSIATGGIAAASFAAGAINAAAIASDAITDAKVASDVTIASVTGAVGSVTGAVGSVTAAVTIDKTMVLSAARNVSAIADTSLTLNDALHCAIAAAAGQETVVGTTYTVKTPSTATTLRVFTLDSGSSPTTRT